MMTGSYKIEIDFDTAVNYAQRYHWHKNAQLLCTLEGRGLEMLPKRGIKTLHQIRNGEPLHFKIINKTIHKYLKEVDYIAFWHEIKIYI